MTGRSAAHTHDEVLLRRFGLVRAVGGAAYFVAVWVLFAIFGRDVWPLALGVPVLAVVTTGYFYKSREHPRGAVAVSLVADALVLSGAVAFLGGTGSGLVLLYAIVVVSAGILLGPAAARRFTVFVLALGLAQLALEEVGAQPLLLHREDLGERLPILLVSLAGLASVGFLVEIYASRLHELIAEAGARAAAVRLRGHRRREFVRHAHEDVQAPLRDLEAVAGALDRAGDDLGPDDRRRLAARLRMSVSRLDAEVGLLADAGALDEWGPARLEPVALRRAVEDCLVGLGERLRPYVVAVEVPALKVVGDRRGARRVVLTLLENVVEHTPAGTRVAVSASAAGDRVMLTVSDDGPGVDPARAARLFEPAADAPRVGLPLARELCEAMGADIRCEPEPTAGTGARFVVSFRLAPRSAPSVDDEPSARPPAREAMPQP